MTNCELIIKPITRMVEEEKKSLDEIAAEVCPKVKHGREKIIRVIKDFISPDYLIKHSLVLGYDVGKAQLAKKRKTNSHKKINARKDSDYSDYRSVEKSCDNATVCCSKEGPENSNRSLSGNVLDVVRNVVETFGMDPVREALDIIMNETSKDTIEKISADIKFPLNLDAININSINQADEG